MAARIYNQTERFEIIRNMKTYGGGFVKGLGEALSHADHQNSIRIYVAFPEYCLKYLNPKLS